MATNKNRTPSAILNSALLVPNHTKRDSFTPMPSKASETYELPPRNLVGNRSKGLHQYKQSYPSNTEAEQITWSNPFDDSPPKEIKERQPINRTKASPMLQRPVKDENAPVISSSTTNRHLGPWPSDEGNTKKPVYHVDGRKSYTRLWKEGKDMRDALKNTNVNRQVNVEQEATKVNSYLKQHQNKRVKNSAAHIIQRWYRECRKKKLQRSPSGKSGSRRDVKPGKGSVIQAQGIKRTKDDGNNRKAQNSGIYEYEELETEKDVPQKEELSCENRVLEEMYRQMQANIMSRLDKKHNQSYEKNASSNKDLYQRNLDSYSSMEQGRSFNEKQIQSRKSYRDTSPDKMDTWERSQREQSFTYRDYERAAIRIQRAARRYLEEKSKPRFGNRTNSRESFGSRVKTDGSMGYSSKGRKMAQDDNMYKIIEQLANELKQANMNAANLQKDNERLKIELVQNESRMEKTVDERVATEKAKFKGMLDEYTQFIDKMLQEKMNITQHYETVLANNKELKTQLSKYEAADSKKEEVQNRVEELENENNALKESRDRLLEEIKALQEDRQTLCPAETVNQLQEENDQLKGKVVGLEINLQQAMEKISKYSEVGEINQILLQKLQYAGAHIADIEEKLRVSQNQCKTLEQQYSGQQIDHLDHEQATHIEENSQRSPLKPQKKFKDEEEVIIEDSNAYTATLHSKRSLLESERHRAAGEPADFSFEAKGSGVYDHDGSHKGQSKVDLEHEDDNYHKPREVESEIYHDEEGGEQQAHPFELRKCSKEYVSGKFAQHEESSCIQENTLDEDQNIEINMLIQNISRKLELAKTKMEDNPLARIDEQGEEEPLAYRKTVSSKEFMHDEGPGLTQETKNRAKSTVNLHKDSFTLEEEQEEKKENVQTKSEKKGAGMKKGIMDTLKKADLLFGRGNSFNL